MIEQGGSSAPSLDAELRAFSAIIVIARGAHDPPTISVSGMAKLYRGEAAGGAIDGAFAGEVAGEVAGVEEGGVGAFARVSSAFNRLCASTSSGFILRIALKSSAAFALSPAIIWAWARRRYPSGSFGSVAIAFV